MPQIAPYLAIEAGVNHVELHILDGGGRPQLILELNEDQCRNLSDQLQTLRPIETVEAEAVPLTEEEYQEYHELEPVTKETIKAPSTTDWADLTKAEIVAIAQDRFHVDLDIHNLKDDLIAAAVLLEEEAGRDS
jgi:hypothetical protein